MELLHTPETPWSLFNRWFEAAQSSEPGNPEAMSLATVGADGVPQVRTVLLKQIDPSGLVFFTNSRSTKGRNLAHQPEAALLFYWRTLDRQIRINGAARPISKQEADAYFQTRKEISQIGAWASQQSSRMAGPETLVQAVEEAKEKFAGQEVPRPPHWWGYRLVPKRFEFWIQEEGRLHQRIEYIRTDTEQDRWDKGWLYP